MAQMVPGDQINVALRKQLLLGMFPASPAAAHSRFYYLLFFRTAAGVSLQLCGNMFKAGPCKVPARAGPWSLAALGMPPPCLASAAILLLGKGSDGGISSSISHPAWSSTILVSHNLYGFTLCKVLPFLPCFPAEPKHLPV